MSPLNDAPPQGAKRLLELFPIGLIRRTWNEPGTKEEVCQMIAETETHQGIVDFVDLNLGCCKQHIYVFQCGDERPEFPATLAGRAPVKKTATSALYILRTEYRVVLKDPYEDATLEFLWPVRLELSDCHLVARFVVLEKNLASYFERPHLLNERGVDEKDIVQDLVTRTGLAPADLHAGVKALWVENYMDSIRARYKRPKSLASEAMDEEMGIKENDPELYERLQDAVILGSLFMINKEHPRTADLSVQFLSIDPSVGQIAFPRYTARPGDTDRVVQEILSKNQ